jgi:hypothetical protein
LDRRENRKQVETLATKAADDLAELQTIKTEADTALAKLKDQQARAIRDEAKQSEALAVLEHYRKPLLVRPMTYVTG